MLKATFTKMFTRPERSESKGGVDGEAERSWVKEWDPVMQHAASKARERRIILKTNKLLRMGEEWERGV